MFNCPCVILAGGKSSRMGKDKALLSFKGHKTLCEYQASRLTPLFKEVFVSAKKDKFSSSLKLIVDGEDIYSPMIAFKSIFSKFKDQHIFILAVDTPNIKEEQITSLYEHINTYDIVIPKTKDFTHQLCGFYHSSLANKCEELAKQNIHKLQKLLEISNTKYIEFENEEAFINLNYPHEYKKAIQ